MQRRRSMRFIRLMTLLALVTVLNVSCSRLRFIYDQTDWMVPRYVQSFVSLDDGQRQWLTRHWKFLRRWHCQHELPRYAKWLGQYHRLIIEGSVDEKLINAAYDELAGFFRALLQHASEPVLTFFGGLSNEQVVELKKNLVKFNTKYRAEVVKPDPERRRKKIKRTLNKRLRFWLAEITPPQQQRINETVNAMRLMGRDGLLARERWQEVLLKSLSHRRDRRQLSQALQLLFVDYRQIWLPAYKEKYRHNRRLLMMLLANILSHLSDRQKANVSRRVEAWLDDLRSINCNRL